MVIFKLMLAVVAADFVSGFVHWLEDAYARPDMALVGGIARDNLRHHEKPREFISKSWWQSSWDLCLLGLAGLGMAALTHHLNVYALLFTALVVNANQIHKWAHSNRQETPRLVRWLQQRGILQTVRHHALHHRGERNSHYCVITNVLNPALEAMRFWSGLEALIEALTGLRRRSDADYLPQSVG
jgi:ubiquitin-conjugating enzyme E2 variant